MVKRKEKSRNLEIYFIIIKVSIVEEFHWTETDDIILNI